jgi:(1->4)-alpha-D-glucan 1-alpha-D-glucosylmutase
VLLLDFPPFLTKEQKEARLRFVMRWQQFTGPIMAKGMEDTALFVYNPLASMNEVGGTFREVSVESFHRFNLERVACWPHSLNATSTHDTKRSEDVRARINVLSELPGEWEARVESWREWNRCKKAMLDGSPVPDPNEEWLIYQTLVGAWPLARGEIHAFKERLKAYVVKAAREAKVHTRWVSPCPKYEAALVRFVGAFLEETAGNAFLKDFLEFQPRVAYLGALNSLSQVVLKIASPGVPDFYQGTELWDFSLVDPDNRRPVDFRRRVRLLKELGGRVRKGRAEMATAFFARWRDGVIKLHVTQSCLNLRKACPELFLRGDYVPLEVTGERKENAVAFARRLEDEWAVAVVGRFLARMTTPETPPLGRRTWGEDAVLLPKAAPSTWHDVLTDDVVQADPGPRSAALPLHQVFSRLPVAFLSSRPQ